MKFLRMEFNEVKFNIYAEEGILKLIKCFWQLTLCNVTYNSDDTGDIWRIRIDLANEESTVVDKKKKTIRYKVVKEGYINSINCFIREFIVKVSLTKGYIWLHASAFAIDNKGILIVGKKGNGKTTQLLNSCYNYGARVIGNDQIPVILKDGKLLTYRWRPDVKISASSLQIIGIKDKIDSSIEKLMWMPDKSQLSALDCINLSERRHQKIIPYSTSKIKIANLFEYEITKILFLSDNQNPMVKEINSTEKKELIQERFKEDAENIDPKKFIDWMKEIPYWRRRILNLNLEENASQKAFSTILHIEHNVKCYRIYKRISINDKNLHQILVG